MDHEPEDTTRLAERLALATEAAQIGIWDWDLTANTFVYSPIAKAICGFSPDAAVTYEDILTVTHPEDLPRTHGQFERAVDPGVRDASPYEYRLVRPSGEVRFVVAYGRAVFEERGGIVQAVRYLGTLQDITERRRLEHAERAFGERLRLVMKAGSIGAFDYDLAAGTTEWDATELAIFGLTQSPRSPEEVWPLIHKEDLPAIQQGARRLVEEGLPFAADFRVVRPDGETRWCTGYTAVMKDVDGQVLRIFGYTIDITEQRLRQIERAERDALLQSIIDAAGLFVAVVEILDDTFTYVTVNAATAAFYGRTVDAAPFDAHSIGLSPETVEMWRSTMLDIWRSGATRSMEYAFARENAPTAWYLGTYTPIPPGPSGRPRVSFVVIDITARKLADERQALLMREVDHRAKNALAVVQAVVHLTKENEPREFKKAVQGRVAAIARAHGLLALDRWEGLDLHRLLEEELRPYRTEREGRITLHGPVFSLSPSDAQSIALVFHELATNAVKHGALSTAEGDLSVHWTIANSPPELNVRWNEHVPGGLAGLTSKPKGFGHVMLEQTIIRQLGGSLSLRFGPHGLTCRLTIPTSAIDAAAVAAQKPGARGRGRRVLVVEDEALIALELDALLRDLGLVVVGPFATVEAAHRAWRDGVADVAILDVNVAGITSFALAEDIRRAGVPVIFCTGYETVQLPASLADAPRLAKPLDMTTLAATLQAIFSAKP